MPGSSVGLQQLLRTQGIVFGDSALHDFHVWFEGGTLYSDVFTFSLLRGSLSVVGNVVIQGGLTAGAVGVSSQPLLNYVPASLVTNAYPTTTLTGTGTKSQTAFTVTGLPVTAVAAHVRLVFTPGAGYAVGDQAGIFTNVSQVSASQLSIIFSTAYATGQPVTLTIPVTPGASNQLAYSVPTVTGGAQWSVSVTLLGWFEPA